MQIGSHIHLPLVNAALAFDREAAEGFRLDVPSGTSQRFEPGASRSVAIVALRGLTCVPGIQVRPMVEISRAAYAAIYGPPRATRCASATPTSGSRSRTT